MKGSQLSHSDSSNPFRAKGVLEFLFRPLLMFYDIMKICQFVLGFFFTFYLKKN